MSDTLDLILRVRKQGNGAKEAEADLGTLQKQASSLQGAVTSLAGGAGIGMLISALKFSVDAAMDAERVMAATENAIRATGGAAGLTADDVAKMAGALSQISGVEDETIQSGQNLLLTFKEIKGQTFEQASASMLDMAVAMNQGNIEGIDLKGTALQLGKALNVAAGDTTAASTAMSALSRAGVSFTSSQKEAAKAAIEMGDVAAYQAIVLKELESEFGGAAKAAGDTAAGQFGKLQVAVGNLAEKIGGALLPTLTQAAEAANLIITWNDQVTAAYQSHEKSIETTATSYKNYLEQTALLPEQDRAELIALVDSGAAMNAKGESIGYLTSLYGVMSPEVFNAAQTFDIEDQRLQALNTTTQTVIVSEEELKQKQIELKDELSNLNALINGQLGPELERFKEKAAGLTATGDELKTKIADLESKKWLTDAQKAELEDLRGQLGQNNAAIAANAAAHDEASKRILFNLLEQRAAADGLTSAELQGLTTMAQNWGLVDAATAQATLNMDTALGALNNGGSLDAFVGAMENLSGPVKDKTVTSSQGISAAFGETGLAIEQNLKPKTNDVITAFGTKIPDATKKTVDSTEGYSALLQDENKAGGPVYSYIIGLSKIEAGYNAIAAAARKVPGLPNVTGDLPGRAHGGPVEGGKMYTVGEQGPETFVAPADGFIIPHGGTPPGLGATSTTASGGNTVTIVINEGPLSMTDAIKFESEVLPLLKRELGLSWA